jgi:NitT/TauT family transport system ATP-binding protein
MPCYISKQTTVYEPRRTNHVVRATNLDSMNATEPVPSVPPVAVELRAATKTYANGLRALDPIDLQVVSGEFATLLGPSGCGKSTLLRMVAQLSSPTTGGVALWPARRDAVAAPACAPQHLAYVFQAPTLMPWASVERNVSLPLMLAHCDAEQAAVRVRTALALVGLHEFRTLYPRQLSGGMQMRVSIARALVTDPSLLLMDEPFGALDEITRARLDQEIRDLWARRSLTVLFVTHSIYEAVFLSTRVLVMSARPGRILGEIAVDEPHPRTDAFRLSERFAALCHRVSTLLQHGSGAQP